MQFDEVYKRVLNLPDPIIITAHKKPDGDAWGSAIGLAKFLTIMHQRTVRVSLEPCQFDELKPDSVINQADEPVRAKSFIVLDCQPEYDRIGFDIPEKAELICIDHHEDQMEKTLLPTHYISHLPAACLVLVATGLWFPGSLPYYTLGSYTDTLAFKLHTMDVCGILGTAASALPDGTFQAVEADISRIFDFLRKPKGTDKLQWIVDALAEGVRVQPYVDMKGERHEFVTVVCECDSGEWVHDLIYFLQGYAETLVVINLKDLKGSFRTYRKIDLSGVARKFGGGGHPQACGFDLRKVNKSARELEQELISALVSQ